MYSMPSSVSIISQLLRSVFALLSRWGWMTLSGGKCVYFHMSQLPMRDSQHWQVNTSPALLLVNTTSVLLSDWSTQLLTLTVVTDGAGSKHCENDNLRWWHLFLPVVICRVNRAEIPCKFLFDELNETIFSKTWETIILSEMRTFNN